MRPWLKANPLRSWSSSSWTKWKGWRVHRLSDLDDCIVSYQTVRPDRTWIVAKRLLCSLHETLLKLRDCLIHFQNNGPDIIWSSPCAVRMNCYWVHWFSWWSAAHIKAGIHPSSVLSIQLMHWQLQFKQMHWQLQFKQMSVARRLFAVLKWESKSGNQTRHSAVGVIVSYGMSECSDFTTEREFWKESYCVLLSYTDNIPAGIGGQRTQATRRPSSLSWSSWRQGQNNFTSIAMISKPVTKSRQ